VNKRLTLFVVLVAGLLVLVFAWPRVRQQVTTADLTLAAVNQPRSEVVVSGKVKNFGAAPFSLETLLIEEPGKEPYRRQISLDAESAFELALGKPSVGTYRVSLRTRKANWLKGPQEGWLKVPDLVVADSGPAQPRVVRARDYDYQRLSLFASIGLVAAATLLFVYSRFKPARRDGTAT
jgi:hypothetical protein